MFGGTAKMLGLHALVETGQDLIITISTACNVVQHEYQFLSTIRRNFVKR